MTNTNAPDLNDLFARLDEILVEESPMHPFGCATWEEATRVAIDMAKDEIKRLTDLQAAPADPVMGEEDFDDLETLLAAVEASPEYAYEKRIAELEHQLAAIQTPPADGPTEPTARRPFAEVYAEAYGWTLDNDGYLAGLVAGDMGYETTDMLFTDLFVDGQVAEHKALFERGEFPCRWPVNEATLAFVDACANALGIFRAAPADPVGGVGEARLRAIAKDASERVAKNAGIVPQLAFAPILWALQDAALSPSPVEKLVEAAAELQAARKAQRADPTFSAAERVIAASDRLDQALAAARQSREGADQ
jgi:hypothetical protein